MIVLTFLRHFKTNKQESKQPDLHFNRIVPTSKDKISYISEISKKMQFLSSRLRMLEVFLLILSIPGTLSMKECVEILNEFDDNADEKIDRTEYLNILQNFTSDKLECQPTVLDMLNSESPWRKSYGEAACLCQNYESSMCCDDATYIYLNSYPYHANVCEVIQSTILFQCSGASSPSSSSAPIPLNQDRNTFAPSPSYHDPHALHGNKITMTNQGNAASLNDSSSCNGVHCKSVATAVLSTCFVVAIASIIAVLMILKSRSSSKKRSGSLESRSTTSSLDDGRAATKTIQSIPSPQFTRRGIQFLLSSLEINEPSEHNKDCNQEDVFDQKTKTEFYDTGSLASGSFPDIFDDESTVSTLPRFQNLSQIKIVGLCPSSGILNKRMPIMDGADVSLDEEEGDESCIVPPDSSLTISEAGDLQKTENESVMIANVNV
jgi:hypothetical protein